MLIVYVIVIQQSTKNRQFSKKIHSRNRSLRCTLISDKKKKKKKERKYSKRDIGEERRIFDVRGCNENRGYINI